MRRLTIILLFPLTALGGFMFGRHFSPRDCQTIAIREAGHRLINPLLECEYGNNVAANKTIRPLKERIQSMIEAHLKEDVSSVSYYFRDLNNGPWIGLGEDDQFSPASLLKTPVLIAYLKLAESDPALLDSRLLFTSASSPPPNPTPSSLLPETEYTISDLLTRMIVDSDNDAFHLLTLHLNSEFIKKLHQDLGLPFPDGNSPEDFISVRAYADLFRILYNASYLNREMSELALDFLSQTNYQDGLTAGVPTEITVAHKFGIRENKEGFNQLHDCGIVYYPDHPYLICIMTKGRDFTTLAGVIKNLSAATYQELSALYPL